MAKSANILLAVHHKIFRDGIKLILSDEKNFTVSNMVKNKEELLSAVAQNNYNILILDLDMPGLEIPGIIKKLTDKNPTLKILALSDANHPEKIKHVISAGTAGYMFKKRGKKELINAVKVILSGNQYLCDDTIKILTGGYDGPQLKQKATEILTEREREVLNLICREYTNKEIGELLSISVRTVDAHRRNLLQKIDAKNTAGLVKFAIEQNIYSI